MLRVDHIVFPVWNAEASLAFYREVMGFPLIATYTGDDWGGYPWLMMFFAPGDGREIVLVSLRGAKRPPPDGLAKDVRHLAFAESSHIVFPVWNAEASLAFYREVMGFPLIATYTGDDWGGYPWLMMFFAPGDGREIVLVSLRGAKRPPPDGLAKDVRHLAFAESSHKSLRRWREKLTARDIPFWEERHGPQRSIYFADPNGVVLEITAPPSRPKRQLSRSALAAAQKWLAA
jgi:catechol 2,3-dioxygenase-like lactoylglutathione lyase family enzyme